MQTWIITTTAQVADLVDLARRLGGPVTAVLVGDELGGLAGVDRVLTVTGEPGSPVEALAPAVVAAVRAEPGDVVLVPARRAERVLGCAVAAALDAPLVTGAQTFTPHSVVRTRFGGIVAETLEVATTVVLVLDGGGTVEGTPVAGEPVPGESYPVTVTSTEATAVASVDLGAATRVVAAGRGFKAEADLALARELAAALGAELGCSRPLAEGNDWLPKDRYIGVSGQHVSPDLYVAVGVSGQLQHMAGVSGARAIVAINSDEKAPVFAQVDYGIVGDLYEVLPALTAALG